MKGNNVIIRICFKNRDIDNVLCDKIVVENGIAICLDYPYSVLVYEVLLSDTTQMYSESK